MPRPTAMEYDLGWYLTSTYGPEGYVIGFLDQPSYLLEDDNGNRHTIAMSTIKSARKPADLPTKPGYYIGDYPVSPSGRVIIELLNSPAGQWVDHTDSHYLETSWVQKLGKLTRLVPESS